MQPWGLCMVLLLAVIVVVGYYGGGGWMGDIIPHPHCSIRRPLVSSPFLTTILTTPFTSFHQRDETALYKVSYYNQGGGAALLCRAM